VEEVTAEEVTAEEVTAEEVTTTVAVRFHTILIIPTHPTHRHSGLCTPRPVKAMVVWIW
jgi:hypothetical protein